MSTLHYDYLIVGGGMAAASAVRGIRERDPEGSIGILGDEADPPAVRPALSQQLWCDPSFSMQQIWMHPERLGAQVHLQHHATQLDRTLHRISCHYGATFHYHRLLIATGVSPTWQQIAASDRVLYFRTVADYRTLRAWTHTNALVHVAVVGGGWLGLQLAAALSQQDTLQVQLITDHSTLGAQYLPPALAHWLQDTFTQQGVSVRAGQHVLQKNETDGGIVITLENGSDVVADTLVMCTEIAPRTLLALQSGLEVADGIVVNEYLQTADPTIFAAGDVANYPDARLGRQRIELAGNAYKMGACAGRNMAGAHDAYTHTPYFSLQLFTLALTGVGRFSADCQMLCHWQNAPTGSELPVGTVYYIAADKTICGVLLVNSSDAEHGLALARSAIGTRCSA